MTNHVSSAHVVVIGLGNPLRRDDGIGPAVAAAIARRRPGFAVTALDGDDPAALLDTWRTAALAVVVEAVRCPGWSPGSVHRLDPRRLEPTVSAASTHGIDLATAYRLSGELGCRPDRLVVLGVQVADTSLGRGLSPAVAAAVPTVVDGVLAELTRHGGG